MVIKVLDYIIIRKILQINNRENFEKKSPILSVDSKGGTNFSKMIYSDIKFYSLH